MRFLLLGLALLFPNVARAIVTLFGLVILITLLFFAHGYTTWKTECAAHAGDVSYTSANNCP